MFNVLHSLLHDSRTSLSSFDPLGIGTFWGRYRPTMPLKFKRRKAALGSMGIVWKSSLMKWLTKFAEDLWPRFFHFLLWLPASAPDLVQHQRVKRVHGAQWVHMSMTDIEAKAHFLRVIYLRLVKSKSLQMLRSHMPHMPQRKGN